MTDKKKPLDLADFDTAAASDKGAEIQLLHPTTNEPLDVFITVLGKDSEVFRSHIKDKVNARMRREFLAKRRGKEAEFSSAEEIEAQVVELLTVCTTSWRTGDKPTITLRGEDLPFTSINVAKLYTEMLWIRAQIDEAVGDLENFI